MAISKMDNIDYNIEGDEEEWLSLKYVTNPYNRGPQWRQNSQPQGRNRYQPRNINGNKNNTPCNQIKNISQPTNCTAGPGFKKEPSNISQDILMLRVNLVGNLDTNFGHVFW